MAEPITNGVDERGIPVKSDYPSLPVPVLYTLFTSVFLCISIGIGYSIYALGSTSKYDEKVAMLKQYDLGWIYIGFFAVKTGTLLININLGVARKEAKINVPDQQVYKVYTPAGTPPMGYVLMEQEGELGRFNRAQRAYMNFLEQAPAFIVLYLLSGFVFPFPAFILGIIFAVMRVVSAVGYTKSAKERMAGNIFGGLAMGTLEGLLLIAGCKALM